MPKQAAFFVLFHQGKRTKNRHVMAKIVKNFKISTFFLQVKLKMKILRNFHLYL